MVYQTHVYFFGSNTCGCQNDSVYGCQLVTERLCLQRQIEGIADAEWYLQIAVLIRIMGLNLPELKSHENGVLDMFGGQNSFVQNAI